MSQPVFYHNHKSFKVALFGRRRLSDRALPLFFKGNSESICLIKAASTSNCPGFGQILDPIYGEITSEERDLFADATILTESGSSAIIFPADCLGLAVYEAPSHSLGFAHCGRAAMMPQNPLGEEIDNIVTRLISKLKNLATGQPEFVAVTTGSICPKHFTHDHAEAKKFIEPFKQFGPIAFGDEDRGELNIPAIVRQQLTDLGIRPENITHDNLCTYAERDLYSYRQACHEGLDKTKRNALVVVLN